MVYTCRYTYVYTPWHSQSMCGEHIIKSWIIGFAYCVYILYFVIVLKLHVCTCTCTYIHVCIYVHVYTSCIVTEQICCMRSPSLFCWPLSPLLLQSLPLLLLQHLHPLHLHFSSLGTWRRWSQEHVCLSVCPNVNHTSTPDMYVHNLHSPLSSPPWATHTHRCTVWLGWWCTCNSAKVHSIVALCYKSHVIRTCYYIHVISGYITAWRCTGKR